NGEEILRRCVGWGGGGRHDVGAVGKVMASAWQFPPIWGNELRDALLTRIVRTLAGVGGDPHAWLAELAPGQHSDALLARYDLARPDPAHRQERVDQLSRQLADFKRLVDEGDPEAISAVPLLDEEAVGARASGLRGL